MYVYKIINKINYKIYIGKHKLNKKTYFGSGKLIKLAIKKYGKDNFTKEIIEYCNDMKTLNKREIYWIKKLKTQDRTIGYNITSGGEGNDSFLGKKLPKKHRDNISKNHANVKGKNNPMYGKTHTDKVKNKLKKFRTGKKHNDITKHKQSIKKLGVNNNNSKLTDDIVIKIRNDFNNGTKVKELAENYKVNKPCIWKIIHRYTWKHI